MKRAAVILSLLIAACAVVWKFPLFHVVRLDEAQATARATAFNAADFVTKFWNDRLLPSLDDAPDAENVLAAIDRDRSSALKSFGRKMGVGRTTLLVIHGTGTVVSNDKKGVTVSLKRSGKNPDVVLHTGMLFGNVARDATGLLKASDFENSQQFNEISTELNRHIETQVIPILKEQAKAGRQVRFVGCAEVPDNVKQARPLSVIPLVISIDAVAEENGEDR
jgi:predicted lipoprotein